MRDKKLLKLLQNWLVINWNRDNNSESNKKTNKKYLEIKSKLEAFTRKDSVTRSKQLCQLTSQPIIPEGWFKQTNILSRLILHFTKYIVQYLIVYILKFLFVKNQGQYDQSLPKAILKIAFCKYNRKPPLMLNCLSLRNSVCLVLFPNLLAEYYKMNFINKSKQFSRLLALHSAPFSSNLSAFVKFNELVRLFCSFN